MSRLRRILRSLARLPLFFVVFTVAQVLLVRFVTPPVTLTMLGQVWAHAREHSELRWVDHRPRSWPLDHVAARAVVASEDARFFVHRGFDWPAICSVLEAAEGGRPARGASTLTQQVARNVFLWQGGGWVRKGLEAWYTVWLELLVPKERILELYLNVAETGPLTFGFEAGAQRWFQRSADHLTLDQAGRIAGLLPAPRVRTVEGRAAIHRAAFVHRHPAPFPGDPALDELVTAWASAPGPTCVGDRVAKQD